MTGEQERQGKKGKMKIYVFLMTAMGELATRIGEGDQKNKKTRPDNRTDR